MNGFLPLCDAPLCDVGSAIVVVIYQDVESGTIIAYVYAPKVAMLQSVSSSVVPSFVLPALTTYQSVSEIKSSPLFATLQGIFILPLLLSEPSGIGNFNIYTSSPALIGSSVSSMIEDVPTEGSMESWASSPTLVKVNLI